MSHDPSNPVISVIIPTYQHARELPACLNSIFAQTYSPIEIIVVDDGSTDNTNEVIKQYASRFKFIQIPHHGAPRARNGGFKESKGEFLFFCDADVVLSPDALKVFVDALRVNPSASYAYSGFKFGWKKMPSHEFEEQLLRKYNYISTMSLIRRDHFPGFDESLTKFQDWDLWLTMLAKNHVGVWIPEILFSVTPRGGGMSKWLPSLFYRIPWHIFGIKIKQIIAYREYRARIYEKHKIH